MLTLIDAHVHVHDPQQAAELLDAAEKNFASVARDIGRPQWQGVLMLAGSEPRGDCGAKPAAAQCG